jgi:serine/threonine protein kinase
MPPAPGMIIGGKYRLERKIATGGQGSIWLARHTQLDSEVAVKLMEPNMAASPQARARFEHEAKAAARIRHQNLVHVQDCGVEGDLPYLVMEYCQGEDLGKRLRAQKRLSLEVSTRMFFQIAKGLKKLHEAGYVHRDLKPGNIFLAKNEDGDEIVKLLDFGIIKDIGGLIGEGTKTGEFMGSPHYMSPQQIQSAKTLDARSDLWSMGVVLYRMLTGALPFPAEAIGAVVAQILSFPFKPVTEFVPELPPATDAFFARALARQPDQRFQTVMEMAEAFGQLSNARAPMPSIPVIDVMPGYESGAPPIEEMVTSPIVRDPTTIPQVKKGDPQAAQQQHPQQQHPQQQHPQQQHQQQHPQQQQYPSPPQPSTQQQQPGAQAPWRESRPSAEPSAMGGAGASPYARRASDPMFGAVPSPGSATPAPGGQQSPTDTPSGQQSLADLTATVPISPDQVQAAMRAKKTARLPASYTLQSPLLPPSAQPQSGPQSGPPGSAGGWRPSGPHESSDRASSNAPPMSGPSSSGSPPSNVSPPSGAPSSGSGWGGSPASSGPRPNSIDENTVVGGRGPERPGADSAKWWLVGGLIVGAGLGMIIAVVMVFMKNVPERAPVPGSAQSGVPTLMAPAGTGSVKSKPVGTESMPGTGTSAPASPKR